MFHARSGSALICVVGIALAASAAQGGGSPSDLQGCPFFPFAPIPVGLGPQGIAQGDLDDDRFPELVVVNTLDNTVQILRNGGGSAFIPDLNLLNSFGQPVAVAIGDLDFDNAPDIAVANRLGDSVTIYYNNGSGGFNTDPDETIPVGDGPVGLVIFDIPNFDKNRGGKPLDIITANFNAGTASLIFNNGEGSFDVDTEVLGEPGSGPSGIAADHDDQIVYVTLRNEDSVAVIYDDFDNGFEHNDTVGLDKGCAPTAIAVGNIDDFSIDDIAVLCSGDETIRPIVVSDDDLRGGFSYFFSFQNSLPAPGNPVAVTLAPFSQSFIDDLAYVAADTSTITIFKPLFDRGFSTYDPDFSLTYSTELGPSALVAIDTDLDDDFDIAVANSEDSSVSILRNKGQGFLPVGRGFSSDFASFVIYESGVEPRNVAFGDLNGDFLPDLVSVNFASDDLSVYINLGYGRYADEERYTAGVDPRDIAIADLNGDGRLDLAVANRQSDNISVILNNGSNAVNARFAPQMTYPAGDAPVALAIGNIDGAGLPDIAVANEQGATISLLFNAGGGVMTPQPPILSKANFNDIALGDVDFDLDQDIVVISREADVAVIFDNNGSGLFEFSGFVETGDEPVALALVSLDFGFSGRSEPDLDIAVACQESGTVSIFRNEGFGTGDFVHVQELFVAPGLSGIAAGRIEADFDTDLVVTSESLGTAYVLTNSGDGLFQPALTLPIGTSAAGAALADLDDDSRADLAVVNPVDNMVDVVINLGFVPTVPPTIVQPIQIQILRSGYVEGSHIRFTVGAAGNSPFTYQWFRNEEPIIPDGERITLNPDNGSLDISPLELGDAGFYEVRVIDACGLDVLGGPVQLFVDIRDTDGDGVRDADDNCPLNFNPEQEDLDKDTLGDVCDPDIDSDELPNEEDNCPFFFNPGQEDLDNDNIGDPCDNDVDGDGVNNEVDNCPTSPNADQLNTDKDEEGDACDADDDNDGVLDQNDNCPTIPNADQANQDGDSFGDACDNDTDNDGVPDPKDNCPTVFNPDQIDADMDEIGDACDANVDADHDGVDDGIDNCPGVTNPDQADQDNDNIGDACDPDLDGDGVLNGVDNCLFIPNPAQGNIDGDMLGDSCDPDIDEDGILNAADNCPGNFNPLQENQDKDALGDICDPDRDGDGVLNAVDNCPTTFNPDQADADNDDIGDACDEAADTDEDGVPDPDDNCPNNFNPKQEDGDEDGIGDACDKFPDDFDNDGVIDSEDNCPMVYNPAQIDNDEDGLGDGNHSFAYREALAMAYSTDRNQMFLSDLDSNLYTIDVGTAVTTFIGEMSDQLGGDIKGLAFVPGKGEVLFGIENGFNVPENNRLHIIDPTNGDILFSVQVTIAGHEVRNSNGLAMHPSTGVLWAVVRSRTAPEDPTLNRLVTIDPGTGVATLIGDLPANFAAIAFRSSGVLYGVTGESAPAETLFIISTNDASVTQLFTLGNGDDGEAIAFHPNGLLYHASGLGDGTEFFESVNVDTQVVIDLSAGCDKFPNDTDNDGVVNKDDNCPFDFNPDQADSDENGIGDVCDKGGPTDSDKDGIPDDSDNCPTDHNPFQEDADDDGIGDVCDSDADNDKFDNESDNCPLVFNPGQEDFDEDGVGNACDNCRRAFNPSQADTRGHGECPAPDGIGDACDCDGDADRDGDVDFADITEVLTDFGFVYGCPVIPPNNAQGDADLNGTVNFADITAVLRSFLLTCQPEPPQAGR